MFSVQFRSNAQKYWRFSFNISPTSEHPGLISLRMDWLDLFAVQGTLKSLLHTHMDTLSLTKEARIYNGVKTISLTSGAGKTGQPLVKE